MGDFHKFVVVFPGGCVRGSYKTEKEARRAADKHGFAVVEIKDFSLVQDFTTFESEL